jgi:hypothetical protein
VKKCKLTDLKGLGKHIWKGVDAQEYVNELRGKSTCTDCLVIKVRGFGLNTRLSEAKKYAKEIMGSAKKKKLTKSQYLKLAEMIRRA